MHRRMGAIALIACLFATIVVNATKYTEYIHNEEATVTGEGPSVTTLHLWYTDEAMTDYLNSASLAFYEKTGVKVNTEYQTGLEYIEEINDASLHTEQIPDLYIVSNDSLEKAYLTGLASEIQDLDRKVNTQHFPQTAINAVTYKGKQVAYPMYFETSAFVYNKTHLEQMARKALEAEDLLVELEAAGEPQEEIEEDSLAKNSVEDSKNSTEIVDLAFEARVENRMAEMLPESMDEILAMADEYDMAEDMSGFFVWDVSDIFYNYFFLGNYLVVGGECGDDVTQLNILNDQTIDCLSVYQRLNQFFSIDVETTDYEQVVSDMLAGKYLFTIATSDIIHTIEAAKANNQCKYEFGVMTIPAVSDGSYFVEEYIEDENGEVIEGEEGDVTVRNIGELEARNLSVTYGVAVNGYSENQEIANQFASFLSTEYLDTLYSRTGKMACSYDVSYDSDLFAGFIAEYEKSISMPKVTVLANFWMQLEVCFTKIWEGESTSEQLRSVNNLITMQIKRE